MHIVLGPSRPAGPALDRDKLRAVLREREIPQWRLSASLGVSPPQFTKMLQGRSRWPPRLAARVERALGVAAGSLVRKPAPHP